MSVTRPVVKTETLKKVKRVQFESFCKKLNADRVSIEI